MPISHPVAVKRLRSVSSAPFLFDAAVTPTFSSRLYPNFGVRHAIKLAPGICSSTNRSLLKAWSSLNSSSGGGESSTLFHEDGGDGEHLESEELRDEEEGIVIEMEKTGKNRRRIRSKIAVDADLKTLWRVLTDYERLSEFIPSLAVSQLLLKRGNLARLFQIGEQDLVFGLKFNAKGIVDCYEKDLENLPNGQRQDIEFKMIEGDFQLFKGRWSIEQLDTGRFEKVESLVGQEFKTTLSYIVDVEPKLWLPVGLVEGRICREIKMNLTYIRLEASKLYKSSVPDY